MDYKNQQDIFDEIKHQVDPEELLNHYGIKYDKQGERLVSTCPLPYHDDSDPSFHYYHDDNPPAFKCYGCKEWGSALDIVMAKENIGIIDAAYKLSELFNIDIALKPEDREKIQTSKEKLDTLNNFINGCHDFFIRNFYDNKAMNKIYKTLINKRHIDKNEIEKAKIGWGGIYQQNDIDPVLKFICDKYDTTIKELDEAHLIVDNGYGNPHSKFCGYYTLPFIDGRDKARWMSARLYEQEDLTADYIDAPVRYKQLSSNCYDYADKNQVYNEGLAKDIMLRNKSKNKLIITEGQFDALSLAKHGYPAIATSGTSINESQIENIMKIYSVTKDRLDNVYIAFDREDTSKLFTEDESTEHAFELSEELLKNGISNKIVKLPQNIKQHHATNFEDQEIVEEIDVEELLKVEFKMVEDGEEHDVNGIDIFKESLNTSKTLVQYYKDIINRQNSKVAKAEKLKEALRIVSNLDPLLQTQHINDLSKSLEAFTKKDIQSKLKAITKNSGYTIRNQQVDLSEAIRTIEEQNKGDTASIAKEIADIVVERLENYGRNKQANNIFFHTRDFSKTYLLFDGDFIEINKSKKKFKAMLSRFAGGTLNTSLTRGRAVTEELEAYAINNGEPIEDISWSETIVETDEEANAENLRVYFPLANKRNELVKLGGDEIQVTPNAVNEDDAIIRMPKHMKEWEYKDDVNFEETMNVIKETIWDKMAVSPDMRLFLLSTMFAVPMLKIIEEIAHVRLQAATNTGKSQIGKMITSTILGDDRVSNLTNAAMRALLENSPLVCLDEFEANDFNQDRMRLIRIAVTGGQHNKMSKENEREVISQALRAMIYTTGIDKIEDPENRNRTFVVGVDKKYYAEEFDISRIKRRISKFRDNIMSVIMKVTHNKIIPQYIGENAEEGEDPLYYRIKNKLNNKWGDHPLNRLFGYIPLVAMYAREISKYMPKIEDESIFGMYSNKDEIPDKGTNEYMTAIVEKWLKEQRDLAWSSMTINSKFINYFENIYAEYQSVKEQIKGSFGRNSDEYENEDEYMMAQYNVTTEMVENDDEDNYFEIKGNINDVYQLIGKISRKNGSSNTIARTPGRLFTNLKNEIDVIEQSGWDVKVLNGSGGYKDIKDTSKDNVNKINLEIRKEV